MNRRSNKILKDLILGIHADVSGLEEKYNIQERTIRADIKELNKDLEAYELPVIASDLDGKLWIDIDTKVDIRAYEKFISEYDFYTYYLSKGTFHDSCNDTSECQRICDGGPAERKDRRQPQYPASRSSGIEKMV